MGGLRILMSGGGSGGHIFPALAIAEAIKNIRPDAEFLFVGAEGKMEMEKVPKAGYSIEALPIVGFHRKKIWKNIGLPFKLLKSLRKAGKVIKTFDPQVAVGTGGYASGPALRMAQKRKVPTLIQEQNALPSVTNRLLSKRAKKICVAFEGLEKYFPKNKILLTGNPIRDNIKSIGNDKVNAAREFGLDASKPTLFVTGGSLGARAINEGIQASIEKILMKGIQVIWQTGGRYIDEYRNKIQTASDQLYISAFITRMDLAYTLADVIVSRAGGTISELAIVGKPCILLPSPNVAEDHQTKNVMALVQKEAAVLVKDSEAVETLGDQVLNLFSDSEKARHIANNLKAMAKPNASIEIAQAVLSLVK